MAVLSVAQGAMSGMAGASQARASNKAAMRQYKHQLKVRERNWYQELSIWGAKRNKYKKDLNENDLAAMRGYSQAQAGLNEVFSSALQSNEKALIEYLGKAGKMTAAGRTGRSAKRIAVSEIAALERHAGRTQYAITQSREKFKANVENIRLQQLSQRSQLFGKVAFEPVPDVAPPPPVLQSTSAPLMMGILGGVMNAASGLASAGAAKNAASNTGGMFGDYSKLGDIGPGAWGSPLSGGSSLSFPKPGTGNILNLNMDQYFKPSSFQWNKPLMGDFTNFGANTFYTA